MSLNHVDFMHDDISWLAFMTPRFLADFDCDFLFVTEMGMRVYEIGTKVLRSYVFPHTRYAVFLTAMLPEGAQSHRTQGN